MGRKRKRAAPDEDQNARIFCYYCDRNFHNEHELLSHQREKHLRCPTCNKRMLSVPSLMIHSSQMHNVTLSAVPNAIKGRDSPDLEVLGMDHIPNEYYQNILAKKEKEREKQNKMLKLTATNNIVQSHQQITHSHPNHYPHNQQYQHQTQLQPQHHQHSMYPPQHYNNSNGQPHVPPVLPHHNNTNHQHPHPNHYVNQQPQPYIMNNAYAHPHQQHRPHYYNNNYGNTTNCYSNHYVQQQSHHHNPKWSSHPSQLYYHNNGNAVPPPPSAAAVQRHNPHNHHVIPPPATSLVPISTLTPTPPILYPKQPQETPNNKVQIEDTKTLSNSGNNIDISTTESESQAVTKLSNTNPSALPEPHTPALTTVRPSIAVNEPSPPTVPTNYIHVVRPSDNCTIVFGSITISPEENRAKLSRYHLPSSK